jgi:acylphosphatase
VRGEVQGVNFRRWTAQQADALGLTGWVKNTVDGHVEGAAVGDDGSVDKL